MHKLRVRAAEILYRYTFPLVMVSMLASPAFGQSELFGGGGISENTLELLQELDDRRPADGGQRSLGSALDEARERIRRMDPASDEFDPRLLLLLEQAAPPSALEEDYTRRSGKELSQFGYDLFWGDVGGSPLVGAVQDSYMLGVGDNVVITFRGQESETYSVEVDREGRVVVPDLPPIPAAGRPFGQFREHLKQMTAQTFLGTEVFVSVGGLRAVRVLVVGEVPFPGFKQVTSLSSALDALALAGGISKTGSLRQIQLIRKNKAITVDLYDLMLRGHLEHDLNLVEGDRIFVPSLGATTAIGGWVKRPGIYELPPDSNAIAMQDLIGLAGGHLRPHGIRHLHFRPTPSGKQEVVEVNDLEGRIAGNGDIVLVALSEDEQIGDVSIDGHVRTNERRSLAQAPTLIDLVRNGAMFEPDPYLLFAAVETTDERTLARRYYPVSIERVLVGAENFSLRDGDRLIIFSQTDIAFLRSMSVQAALAGLIVDKVGASANLVSDNGGGLQENILQAAREEAEKRAREAAASEGLSTLSRQEELLYQQRLAAELEILQEQRQRGKELENIVKADEVEVCRSLDELSNSVKLSAADRFSNAVSLNITQEEVDRERDVGDCPEVFDMNPGLLVFALDHVINMAGEVRKPGPYPVTPGTPANSLMAVAGGVTRSADMSHVELTRITIDQRAGQSRLDRTIVDFAATRGTGVYLNPGDVVRFNQVFSDLESGVVILRGEVRHPGKYRIRRGETLSEVMSRAGGLTPQAYPFGAIFTRESAKGAERDALERSIRDLESSLATAATTRIGSDRANVNIEGVTQLIESIRTTEPIGRVVIEADPTVLQVRPELDILLQPGDILYMPKRPNSVVVTGEVLNPGSQLFVSGSRPEKYIDLAGGTRPGADDSRTYMILPNGEAQPLSLAFWNYDPVLVPPGTTIVVPRDPAPFDFLTIAKDITQIMGQLAITAASIAVINDN